MPDEVPPPPEPPAVSPTGTPIVPARLVPYFWIGLSVTGALAGASQLDLGLPPQVFSWAMLASIVFAGLLGTTPGARK